VPAEDEAQLVSVLQAAADHPTSASAPRLTATVVDEENGDRGVWDVAIHRRTVEP
jgi:hypothetical protein